MQRSSTYEYVSEDNMIVGMIFMRPLSGWWGKNIGLRLTSRALNTVWELNFPVQTVASSLNETLEIGQSFAYQGDKYEIQSVTFTPSRTVVTYFKTFANAEPIGGKLGIPHSSPRWSLIRADGTEVQSFGGHFGSDGKRGQGELFFAPVKDESLALFFQGTASEFEYTGKTTLALGSFIETPQGVLRVAEVHYNPTSTQVELQWDAESELKKLGAELVDSTGSRVQIAGWGEHPNYISLSFEHGELIGPLEFHVSTFYIHEQIQLKVCDIQR